MTFSDPIVLAEIALVAAVALLSFGGGAVFLHLRRRHAHEAERRGIAEARLADAVESISAGVVLVGAAGDIDYVNARFRSLVCDGPEIARGIAAERLIKRLRARLDIAEDVPGAALDRLAGALANPKGADIEFALKDGRFLSFRVSATEDGGRILLVLDSTERMAREAAVRRSEARFRDLVDLSSDWVFETDEQFRLTYVSENVARHFDAPPSAFIGLRRDEIAAIGEDAGLWRAHLAELDLAHPFRDFEYVLSAPGGRTRRVKESGQPYFAADGAFLGYRGVGQDVTVKHLAETDARRMRAILGEALEAISEGFALFDADDRLVTCNSKFFDRHPSVASILTPGRSYVEILRAEAEAGEAPEAEGRVEDWIEASVMRKAAPGTVVERRLKDGGWLGVSDYPTADGGRVVLYTDISEIKEHEQALGERIAQLQANRYQLERQHEELARLAKTLAAARDAAEHANRAKSVFLATMSHELKTPLNAIIGFSEMIRDSRLGPIGEARYADYAGDIHACGLQLLALINDVLDISRLDAGRLELDCEPLDIGAFLADWAARAEEQAAAAGLAFVARIADALPAMNVDEHRIEQILGKIYANALKFTPKDGEVGVCAAATPEGGLSIAISDTGIGIAPEHIGRVTESFVQIDDHLSRRFGGSGLGLPLAKAMIELHGGALAIASAPGEGTTVTVALPASRRVS